MNTTLVRRSTILSAACLAALIGAGVASAAPAQKALEALANRGPANDLQLPSHARAQSGVLGVLNAGALSASALELTLADGTKATARLQRVARDDNKGVQSWVGTFDASPGSVLTLSKAKGVVTGLANYKDQVIEILPSSGGKHVMFAVDDQKIPAADGLATPSKAAGDTSSTTSDYGTGGSTLAAGDSVVQDLLVVYTAAAAAAYGQGPLESMIQSAVQSANQAYQNSQVGITLNMAGLKQVALTEQGGAEATLSALQSNGEVKQLRDQVAADLVVMVSQDSNWCGYANIMTSNSTGFAGSAYGVVFSACLSNQSLAHEVGHLQGLDHDRENSAGYRVYPYSYGYRVCATDGFSDIMAYKCSGLPRVLQFSNPYVRYNGFATGVAYESSTTSAAENARSLNSTAATVAAFRGPPSTIAAPSGVPATPSNLLTKSLTYSQVNLAWVDNATNESGYKVERSGDGVSFAEVASLGTSSTGFSDTTVSARTGYYYRVRAFSSAGVSAYSNTLQVTTLDVPPPAPPAPTSVAATDNANGSATVWWNADKTGVASFELRREAWDSRKRVWGNAVIAATIPSSVLSVTDMSNNGTYRYSVRAVNSGGGSAYAGPAQVNVTGGKKGGRR